TPAISDGRTLHRPPPETRIFLPPSGVPSRRRTRRPALAAKIAATVPAAPAPTTATGSAGPRLARSMRLPYSIAGGGAGFRGWREAHSARKALFPGGKELFRPGKELFRVRKELFGLRKDLFKARKELFRAGKDLFRLRKELFRGGKELF